MAASFYITSLLRTALARSDPGTRGFRRGDVTSSEARLMWSSDLTVLILVLTPCVIWAMLPQFAAIIIGLSRSLMLMPVFFSFYSGPLLPYCRRLQFMGSLRGVMARALAL